jgi:hypothetical protein
MRLPGKAKCDGAYRVLAFLTGISSNGQSALWKVGMLLATASDTERVREASLTRKSVAADTSTSASELMQEPLWSMVASSVAVGRITLHHPSAYRPLEAGGTWSLA